MGTTSSSASRLMPLTAQKSASVEPVPGADRLDALGVDFRNMPAGMCVCHPSMTSPKVRTAIPRPRR